MSEQQRGHPAPTHPDASVDRNGHDLGTPSSPPDGGIPSQAREYPLGKPGGDAAEAIERATSVVGDDEGAAS